MGEEQGGKWGLTHSFSSQEEIRIRAMQTQATEFHQKVFEESIRLEHGKRSLVMDIR